MQAKFPRLAVRAVIVHHSRLLLVNAWRNPASTLMCAPGGGVEPGQSLHENLRREVHEETGLVIAVGPPCLVNEFHDPKSGFHQIDLFFRCSVDDATLDPAWTDPEGVVHRRRWISAVDRETVQVKPDSLLDIAFGGAEALSYDPLEPLVR